MNKPNTTLVDLVITLKPEILQIDARTGRRFADPTMKDHQYARRLIDGTLTQLSLEGFRYLEVTPNGFVMRWKGEGSAERESLGKFVTGLAHIAQEVQRIRPEQKQRRNPITYRMPKVNLDTLQQWYGAALRHSTYDPEKRPPKYQNQNTL